MGGVGFEPTTLYVRIVRSLSLHSDTCCISFNWLYYNQKNLFCKFFLQKSFYKLWTDKIFTQKSDLPYFLD